MTVTGVADNLSDGDQSFTIVLQADNKTADTRFRDVDPADVVLTNLDLTDKGRFYVSEIKGDTDENGVASYFTVRLSSAPDDGNPGEDNVTITMASSDPDEGQISSSIGNQQTGDSASQLVFTSSNWNAERTVTVVGQPDNYSDGDPVSYTHLRAHET